MKDFCLIYSGGEYQPCPKELTDRAAFIIACDRGYDYTKRDGILPDLVVGDFDSAESVPGEEIPVERWKREKDDSDTMLAVKEALGMGYRDFVIADALGGRLDHLYANVRSAAFIAGFGGVCVLKGTGSEVTAFGPGHKLRFHGVPGMPISVFAANDRCEGVEMSGTYYKPAGGVLTRDEPTLGLSNKFTAETAVISVEKGVLIVIQPDEA